MRIRHVMGATALCGSAVLALFILASSGPPGAGAQSDETVVKVSARTESVDLDDGPAMVDILIENVEDLVAFQFVLRYDGSLLEFDTIQQGDFLGSTGREVICNDPQHDTGSARFECVTLRDTPAGVSGSGRLATVLLRGKATGTSTLSLNRVELISGADPENPIPIPATLRDGSIRVGGGDRQNWIRWGVLAVACGLLAAAIGLGLRRVRGPR